ncbi:outer membrane lipoprotein LolB [Roseateles saccharophilus]|uniref:Outer-membrane lipoprotein LolB n=1 Tax=Roseateles saccharophilus TaxID=304 RepID=A0A4R3UTV9_ROSSA|nr:outer membrane lipoprotein LolB [Roseateles saccharophilus]MDG0833278.1 outer membrane lipoprotein LolB [Roseateles saccharophilus]TCU94371.1 outer membrane lipoprotein LolB [Roseateles saccharophilus]
MRFAATLLLALALTGCAQLRQTPPAATTEARLSGRISVTVAGDVHNRGTGGAASFELFGGPEAGRLELSAPLGGLVARASWQPGLVLLQTPDQERRFDDLDALTREMLGEAVPVAALFDWLQARPWPAAPHRKTAGGFEQLGWRIEPRLPALVATRLSEPTVTLRAKLDGGDEVTP